MSTLDDIAAAADAADSDLLLIQDVSDVSDGVTGTSKQIAASVLLAGRISTAAGSVGTSNLATGAVTSAKIADGAVTAAKVAADVATQAELDAVDTLADQGIADAATAQAAADAAQTDATQGISDAATAQAAAVAAQGTADAALPAASASAFGLTLIDDADAATARTTLGAVGTADTVLAVYFGTDTSYTRPVSSGPVVWTGWGVPDEAEQQDIVIQKAIPTLSSLTSDAATRAWWQVDSGTFVPDAGSGATLPDLSSNGRDATRVTGSNHPSLVAAGSSPLGVDSLLIDAATEKFDGVAGAGPSGGDYIVVFLAESSHTSANAAIMGSSNSVELIEHNRNSGTFNSAIRVWHAPGADYTEGTPTTDTTEVVTIRFDASELDLFVAVNGTPLADGTAGEVMAATSWQIGGYNDTSVTWRGHFSDIAVISSADTDLADRATAYLLDRAGLI